jgi:hypothetical protein
VDVLKLPGGIEIITRPFARNTEEAVEGVTTPTTKKEGEREDPLEQPKLTGNPDQFQLLFKFQSNSEGIMKSTKAMQVSGGCIVQVTTERWIPPDGPWAVAEALTFVPNMTVVPDDAEHPKNGRHLEPITQEAPE